MGYLIKRMLGRTYYRIWALAELFEEGFEEGGMDSPD